MFMLVYVCIQNSIFFLGNYGAIYSLQPTIKFKQKKTV